MRHSHNHYRGIRASIPFPLRLLIILGFCVLVTLVFITYKEIEVPRKLHAEDSDNLAHCPSSDPPPYVLRIVVFTYNRIEGLKRLLRSLNTSHYRHLGPDSRTAGLLFPNRVGKTTLTIYVDYPKKKDKDHLDGTRNYLDNEFVWSHGPVTIHYREVNVGLKRNIMEAWYPSPRHISGGSKAVVPREFCAFFEDDTEVSPQWFRWVDQALKTYVPEMLLLPGRVGSTTSNKVYEKLLGLSLFRPIKDELSGRLVPVNNDGYPFILQQPCSWGAVYFPDQWLKFRQWYRELPADYSPIVSDDNDKSIRPSSNDWATESSWKKYLIQFMYLKGLYMIYPNLASDAVLSTNHLMKGEHITPERKYFELPIFMADTSDAEDSKTVKTIDQSHDAELLKFATVEELWCFNIMFKDCGRGPANLHNY